MCAVERIAWPIRRCLQSVVGVGMMVVVVVAAVAAAVPTPTLARKQQ